MSIFCSHDYIPVKIYDYGMQPIDCGSILFGYTTHIIHLEKVIYQCVKCDKKIVKEYYNGELEE